MPDTFSETLTYQVQAVLTDTVCGTSVDPDTGQTWGVCVND